ncbi:LysM peptidoglycan-binding domain-containing protein [Radiobacillus kanasensis]|uniref:LysM peptidoglycan-binding domain-containing protein n=1 Tax=Radiobacillus kanasensis TaxID=2844358 RepID=UPI001E35FAC2|nr:LysM peptidoglycan-binding domain-containing protein [Radiobacillus kanasensis]UFT97654.1 LysM peptidoglycan-binding domain-containing protein [Radiobacillus kanasensis]
MDEKTQKDQAYNLRSRMHGSDDEQPPRLSSQEEKELNILELPPRSQIHTNKKTKVKWKISFPFVRFLVLLFLIITVLVLTYKIWGEDFLQSKDFLNETETDSSHEEVIVGEKQNKEPEGDQQSLVQSKEPDLVGLQIYNVKEGDTLSSIAIEFYGNAEDQQLIIDVNGLTNKTLKVGQVLKIPPKHGPK